MSNQGVKQDPDIASQLRRLTFGNNFQSALLEVSLAAATEDGFNNPFRRAGKVPQKWLIVDDRGVGVIKRGATDWTKDTLYFQNVHATNAADATILLMLE